MRTRLAGVLFVPLTVLALIAGCSRGGTAPTAGQADQPAPPRSTVIVKGTVHDPLAAAGTNAFEGKRICVVAVKGSLGQPDITVDKKTLEFTTGGSAPASSTIDSDGHFEVAIDRSLLQKLGNCTLLVVDTTASDLLDCNYVGSGSSIIQFGPTDVAGSQIDLGANLQLMGKGQMYQREK